MTDTTDIAALREQAETAKAFGGMFAISGEKALSLLDQLEAERQRAEAADSRLHEVSVHCANVEAELAALRGEQEYPLFLKQTGIGNNPCQGSYKEYVTIDESEYEENPTKHLKLFTRQTKPVVVLNGSAVMSRSYVVKQIEAAGIVVKVGE